MVKQAFKQTEVGVNFPFHYDIVGSFLRPNLLKKSYIAFDQKKINRENFTKIKRLAVKKLVRKEAKLGLKAITDGEFNRKNFFLDFLSGLKGVRTIPNSFRLNFNGTQLVGDGIKLSGKLTYNPYHPFFKDFSLLNSLAPKSSISKITIPSPTPILFVGPFAVIKNILEFYTNRKDYIKDVIQTYRKTILHFYKLGARYIQLDDPWLLGLTFGFNNYQNQEKKQAKTRSLAKDIIFVIKHILYKLPRDLIITTHICRGNFRSSSLGGGTYSSIVKYVKQLPYDGFFLEYDNLKQDGNFAPLAQIYQSQPKAHLILGLISSKFPNLENKTEIKKEIKQATHYVPLKNLALSPQCGFASTAEGNKLTEKQQWDKLKLMVDVAQEIWKE